jgi:hypothetical protein
MTRNAARSATAAASRPTVCADLLVAVHDRVDGEHQGDCHGGCPGEVDAPGGGLPGSGREHQNGQDADDDPDRDVDQEDPVPVEQVGQHSAEEHAEAAAAGCDESDDTHRLRPIGRLGEQVHDQRQGDSRDHGATEALHGPRADEEVLRAGEAAGYRCKREQRDADQEQPPVPEQVAQPSAEQQEATERQEVGVDHPRE